MNRPRLIPDWRLCYRFLSVQAIAVLLVWVAMPEDMQRAMLAAVGVGEDRVTAVLGVLILAARLVAQPKLDDMRDEQGPQ